jgi:UDP-glucose 4-epimerase
VKILVTGSRGFVGASFGRFASKAGHEVLGISRSSQPEPGWPGHHLQADAAQADLSPVIREFDPDMVLQAAGSASVGASISDPVGDFRAAAVTVTNVLDGVRRSGRTPLLVYPSSAAVYGNPACLPVAEHEVAAPISPYGFHKSVSEIMAREFTQCFGLSTVVCRLFSLFGSAQKRLLVWELYEQFTGPNEIVQIQGVGTETRDFLHIDDLSRVFLDLPSIVPRGQCTTLNVASGTETPILDLANIIRSTMGSEKAIICRGEARPGDPRRWCADIRRLRSLAPEWQPKELVEGLKETIQQWRQPGT